MNQNIHARLISGLDCCLRCIFSSTEIAIRIPQTEQEIVIKMYVILMIGGLSYAHS